MRRRLGARQALDADLQRLRGEQVLEIALDDLQDLVVEPTLDPFVASRSPSRAGVEELAATLLAARRLPDALTVRVLLPPGAAPERSSAEVEAALHRCADALAAAAWREGMAVRSMGFRQLPVGGTVAVVSWLIAGIASARAVDAQDLERVLLALVAIVGITVAWVVSWMVAEFIMIDWRLAARRADAYDLLARATLDVVVEGPPGG